jgi:glycerol-3-phosphate acyltransferase PlsX
MGKALKIAVDIMGGDYAPDEIVKGALQAAKDLGVEIILVGTKPALEASVPMFESAALPVHQVEATEIIKDGEEPAFAVMRKPNSSVAMAARLAKCGDADAMVSAGSTGAVMVAALQHVGALPGIERPMVGGPFLGLAPKTLTLDLGANVGCQPYHLVEFAVAGTVYARTFMGIDNPTVGLLNVGAEEGKGNAQVKEAFRLLKSSGLNFIGNVEGHDIPAGKVNVVVCDGFVGNILVKFCESLGRGVSNWLGSELKDSLNKTDLDKLTSKLYGLMSPGVAMGGGPMWGVDGVVGIAHGSSKAHQIAGTINQVKIAVESGFVDQLKTELRKVQDKMPSEQSQ